MFIVPVSRSSARTRDLGVAIDRLFEGRALRALEGFGRDDTAARVPVIDVVETEAGYTVTAELPGIAKEDVKVSIDGRRVSIEAASDSAAEAAATPKDGERALLRERPAKRFARAFTLPVALDEDASQARLEHGVLNLFLAKKAKPAATRLTIN